MMYPCLYTVLINLEFLKMNKLTSLHSECLANMPMMLDVMTNTVEALSELLNPQYDRIEEYLTEFFDKHKRLKFDFENGREFQSKYIFTDRFTQYKKGALRDLTTVLELYYCIPFGKNVRNGVSFSVQFGYTADETQNVVYFGLGETDSVQYLTDAWLEKIKTESAGDWEIYTNNGYIEFQITPDDQLTDEKIVRCGEDFKNRILKPLLEQLQ
mgnify:CR=1 FL=1